MADTPEYDKEGVFDFVLAPGPDPGPTVDAAPRPGPIVLLLRDEEQKSVTDAAAEDTAAATPPRPQTYAENLENLANLSSAESSAVRKSLA